MLMQNLTNLVVPSRLSQSLVLRRTKDLSSPQGLLGFFSPPPPPPNTLNFILLFRTKDKTTSFPVSLYPSLSPSLAPQGRVGDNPGNEVEGKMHAVLF